MNQRFQARRRRVTANPATARPLSRLSRAARPFAVLLLAATPLACEEIPEKPPLGTLEVSIAPTGPTGFSDEDLTGNARFQHPGDVPVSSITYSWSWKRDGVDSGITSQTVSNGFTTKGEVWEVTSSVDYGTAKLGPKTAEIAIVNKPPEIDSVAFRMVWTPNDQLPEVDNTFGTFSVITDADNDPITKTTEWFLNGNLVQTNVQVDFSNPFIDVFIFDCINAGCMAGDLLEARVTADDGVESSRPRFARSRLKAASIPATSTSGASAEGLVGSFARTSDDSADEPRADTASRTVEVLESSVAPPVAISISELNVCSIALDGSLECGGVEDFELTAPPVGHFTQVDVQIDYACAIRSEDLGVVCWGDPLTDLGQLDPPVGPFARIDLGRAAACGLRPGGEIGCWGDDASGQSSPPEGRFIDLDMSESYGCAIDAEGAVSCWGELE